MTLLAGRTRVRILWTLLAVAVMVLLLKTFVCDVYPVTSGSMRPTLFGGVTPGAKQPFDEHVLLRFLRHPSLERYQLVVIRPEEGGAPIVKRVWGLPLESIQISGGDVLIEGQRLPPTKERPALIPLFDDRYHRVEDDFFDDAQVREPWRREGREWVLEGEAIPAGYDGGMLFFDKSIDDGYLDENFQRVAGSRQVNDAAIECEVLLEEAGGRVRLQLSEEGDTFRALLHPDEAEGESGYAVSLIRYNASTQDSPEAEEKRPVMGSERIPFGAGTWHRLHFANLDNHLVFELDEGAFRMVVPYEENEPRSQPGVSKHLTADRVGFGGEACRARFRGIRVLRDLFFTNAGRYAVRPDRPDPGTQPQLILGPHEYFVLGDNSAESQDSRTFGPYEAAEIVGRPVAVVWPWSRRRWL